MTTGVLLVAHGTARPAARAVVGALAAGVRDALPGVPVRLAHVDVQAPSPAQVLTALHGEVERVVVVPLLLTTGYHVEVDIGGAIDPARDVVTPTLAGHPLLLDVALDRLREAGGTDLDAVVVAATGSSRAGARAEVETFAATAGARLGLPASVGWVAAGAPDVATAVHAAGGRVGVVTLLLAPGVFAEKVVAAAAGAVAVGAPLGDDRRLVEIVLDRYRGA